MFHLLFWGKRGGNPILKKIYLKLNIDILDCGEWSKNQHNQRLGTIFPTVKHTENIPETKTSIAYTVLQNVCSTLGGTSHSLFALEIGTS